MKSEKTESCQNISHKVVLQDKRIMKHSKCQEDTSCKGGLAGLMPCLEDLIHQHTKIRNCFATAVALSPPFFVIMTFKLQVEFWWIPEWSAASENAKQ